MKNKKIIIITIISIILISIIGIFIYKKETSDLVCFRHTPDYLDSDKKDYIIFSFNWLGKVSNGNVETKLTYETLERAQQEFKEFQELFQDYNGEKVKLDNKTIIIYQKEEISLDIEKIGRRKLKTKYEESNYECK